MVSLIVSDKDTDELQNVVAILSNSLVECPNCKCSHLSHTNGRIECIRCGWVKIGRKGQ